MAHMYRTVFLRIGAAAAIASALTLSARAQEAGDEHRGRGFAVRHCAECHAVEPGTSLSPNPGAPSFVSVANTKGMTGRALAVWLDSSHPTMPNFVLKRDDRDNVVAYIMSLKKSPPPN